MTRSRLRIAILAGAAAALAAGPTLARPYLMLNADDRGFQALDLGNVDRSQTGIAQATVIDAPLAGAPYGDQLAPLAERRVEVDCQQPRWRTVSTAYADGREALLARDDTPGAWRPFGEDALGPTVQAAACARQFRQDLVSRYLNIGEILAKYQAAHSRPEPQPLTEKERRERAFRNGH